MTAGGDERSGGPVEEGPTPTEPEHIIPTRCSHRRGCKAVSPAACESVTALAVEEMKEGRAKTQEGPR